MEFYEIWDQYCRINRTTSSAGNIDIGVLPGSCIGPIFYFVFIDLNFLYHIKYDLHLVLRSPSFDL